MAKTRRQKARTAPESARENRRIMDSGNSIVDSDLLDNESNTNSIAKPKNLEVSNMNDSTGNLGIDNSKTNPKLPFNGGGPNKQPANGGDSDTSNPVPSHQASSEIDAIVDNSVNDNGNMNTEPQSKSTDLEMLNSWLNVIAGQRNNRPKTPVASPIASNMVSIHLDDVVDEINYWSSAVLCYVLGDNPPFSVMNGYCQRIWGKKGLDKVSMVGRGSFLVCFNTMEQYERVLTGDPHFFDYKPLIIKKWDPNMELHQESVKTIPIWIRFPNLELKY
ncbi:DNA mismatch repair protein MutS [Bienertia sinuspersici]